MLICSKCRCEIPDGDEFKHLDQVLCEDCYISALSPAKACDPRAVYSDTRTMELSGQQGTEALTPEQKEIYEFICGQGRTTAAEIKAKFCIKQEELDNIFATLRHCELVRGQKEGGAVFIVPF